MTTFDETPPPGQPATRVTTMPADANPYGDIFGGWLLAHMDMAAGLAAARHAKGRAVTVAVEGMKFHRPVFVGDEVSFYATVIKTGTTSMTIDVEAWRRERHSEERSRVTQASFIFVAIDEARRPHKVPPLAAASQ